MAMLSIAKMPGLVGHRSSTSNPHKYAFNTAIPQKSQLSIRQQQRPALTTCAATPEISQNHLSMVFAVATSAVMLASAALGTLPANAQKVGEFSASGFVFKDSVEVSAYDDPEVQGVTVYISDFKRSLVDKINKDFFSEPSQASISCAVTGPVNIRNIDRISGSEGQEVFSEKKGLNIFKDKTTRVRRIYDPARRSLVYVAYSTRLSTAADDKQVSTGRYRTSLCALSLPAPAPAIDIPPPSVRALN